ncbi:MAG: ORF6N domain-containing protein [bacterium]
MIKKLVEIQLVENKIYPVTLKCPAFLAHDSRLPLSRDIFPRQYFFHHQNYWCGYVMLCGQSILVLVWRQGDGVYLIRGQKVMLDRDLAKLYGVSVKRLNEQVKRNMLRFPSAFMFQLSEEEASIIFAPPLRSQIATLKNLSKRGKHRKYLPYAFTEQGLAMLSSVVNSERAILVNIAIMRAFVKMRQILATHKELAEKFRGLESKLNNHDKSIKVIFEVIRKLIEEPTSLKEKLGFIKK